MAGDDPDRDVAIVAAQLGRFLALAGRNQEVTPVLEEALRLAEQQQLWEVYSHALSSRAIELGEWLDGPGRREEAGPGLGEAHEIFERLKWLERLARLPETAPLAAVVPVPELAAG